MLNPSAIQPPQQSGRYNGQVNVQGKIVNVVNGITHYDGEIYYVSPSGNMVENSKKQIIGRVVNNNFVPIDKQYADFIKRTMQNRG